MMIESTELKKSLLKLIDNSQKDDLVKQVHNKAINACLQMLIIHEQAEGRRIELNQVIKDITLTQKGK